MRLRAFFVFLVVAGFARNRSHAGCVLEGDVGTLLW